MFRNQYLTHAVVLLALTASACKDEAPGDTLGRDTGVQPGEDTGVLPGEDTGVLPGEDAGVGIDTGVPGYPESEKATLKFKRNERIRNDFGQTLGLAAGEVCNEFGRYSCTEFVHTIALGGVEPYLLSIRDPLDNTTVTAPIAVDRAALSGCEKRVTQDFADENAAVIFMGLNVDGDGKITDINGQGVADSIDRLYKRALLRPPESTEVAHLRAFYAEIEGTGEPFVARDWAIYSCYAVLTSMESLFY